MVQHFWTCNKNSTCLVMPRYERVFSLVQTFTHIFVMRYLNASLPVMSREHGMPSERWLQASKEIGEQITTRILWKNYPYIRNWGAICSWKSTFKFSCGLLSGELWFCEWWGRWTFPPGHCSNGGQIQREMEPISACWLLLDLDAWFSKFDDQSAGEEGPIALELYETFDLWRSTGKRW